MLDLSENPSPRRVLGSRRPLVRPVSQVSLALSDQNAFETAVAQTVGWLNARPRCDGAIPAAAVEGDPFDLTHVVGAMPASAASYADESQRVWAAKLDYPDRNVGQRTWSTEISVRQTGNTTNFFARLTNVTRGEDPQYSPSVPGIVRNILEKHAAEADEFPISDEIFLVDENTQADFERLLLSKSRRLPILALSQDESGQRLIDPTAAIRRLAGTAHVVCLSNESSWQLTRTYGRRHSVFGGASKLYLPRFDPDADEQFRHPLRRPSELFDADEYLEWLCRRILPSSFVRLGTADELVRVVDVQALVSKKSREAIEGTSSASELRSLVESLNASLAASEALRREDAEAAQTLLDEASVAQQAAEQEKDEVVGENDRLRAKLRAVAGGIGSKSKPTALQLTNYDEFESWADSTLGEHIEITSRAIRETEKYGAPELISRIEGTLLLIRDFYVPMRVNGTLKAVEEYKSACMGLGVDESACFSQKNDIKNFSGYRASFGGKQIWLDRHFKFGNGTDLRRMFRIYFTWDAESQTVVIGHMPTHLDNNVTN